ncbi:MAG: DEAD/DEAH box helicase family protein [Candidatus Riflebacteria bacterium]|nr:DEAD/DEAH box helicase family protein [Candidatus Riflebacteria bacterium]
MNNGNTQQNQRQSNFSFIDDKLKQIREFAQKAELRGRLDTRYACFQARLTAETALKWLFKYDKDLTIPYNTMLSSLINDAGFQRIAPIQVKRSLTIIQKYGNMAAHSEHSIQAQDTVLVVKQLHSFLFWLHRTYFDVKLQTEFNEKFIPDAGDIAKTSRNKILELEQRHEDEEKKLREAIEAEKEDKEALETKVASQEAEIAQLKAQIAAKKAEAEAVPDSHDYSEAEGRKLIIDVLLNEAGWHKGSANLKEEYELEGVDRNKNYTGTGFADYVLFDDNGLPLAVIEAKKTTVDAKVGKYQAYDYANAIEKKFKQRPIIFYTNGYEIFIWDDVFYPERKIQGFYKKDELQLAIERRKSRKSILNPAINRKTVERPYQHLAIRAVTEHFEAKNQRKALLVMATGSGKTRLTIALVEVLQKANWAKRVLFLCDRDSLVKQAKGAFTKFLPNSPAADLRDARSDNLSRVCLSTYHTMMNLINEFKDGERLFSPSHFDLIVIDEAHRSIYQKFGAIFDYFDSFLVGLTATPRDEVDKNTYQMFNLTKETGPVFGYNLGEAIEQGYLLNYYKTAVSTKLSREGLTYSKLSDEDKEEYDKHFIDEVTGERPEKVGREAINKWLFNIPTVDSFLKDLMDKGLTLVGSDKIGKTIIFARNSEHAKFIVSRFDANYPQYKGHFCAQIDYTLGKDAETLIDNFKKADGMPQIAVSVDMLDTGIDVPEVLNLVFAKPVYSKVKFWQMIGRGTRKCEDLFGPGDHKKCFYVFDYCENFEFFESNPEGAESNSVISLSQRIFRNRLLLADMLRDDNDEDSTAIRKELLDNLHEYVANMCETNFLVRPHLQQITKLKNRQTWENIDDELKAETFKTISALPSQIEQDDEYAKRWDHLLLRTELALLKKSSEYASLIKKIRKIADKLEDKTTIPDVREHLSFIQAIMTDEFWQNMNLKVLEEIRKHLRMLIKYVDKSEKKIIYSNFSDTLDENAVFEEGTEPFKDDELAAYRYKMNGVINENLGKEVIWKVRCNRPLTDSDLKQLEEILNLSTSGERELFKEAYQSKFKAKTGKDNPSLEQLIRSIVGLDRKAVEKEFADFIEKSNFSSLQLAFVSKIIDYFVENGFVRDDILYEPPFSDLYQDGPEGLFGDTAELLFARIKQINEENKRPTL